MSGNYSPIPIIDRMSSVLEYVLSQRNGAPACALLRAMDIPKTTLYRLLASMTQNEFLAYHPETGVYTLGAKFAETYISMDERVSWLREVAMPYLQFLANQVQETVKLSVLSGLQSYTISSVEGNRPMRISIDTGAIFPLHAGAAGKVLLASLSEQSIHRYYDLYGISYTDATITSVDEILKELETFRKQGYAIDRGEYMPEIRAVAAPILDPAGQTIAAISIAYPAAMQDHIDIPQLAAQIIQTAQSIAAALNTKEIWERPARLVGE